ncbi:ribonuclease E/G [Azospirillum sp.]|uniref:ribonuclease E/G n=1 Tax=Azospirillum sp. TaxID=34012 RepID=UPI003D71E772
MTPREILVDRDGPLTRAAVLTGGRLSDLYIDNAERPSLLGSIFLGRVERIATGLDAAFIDLGIGKSGLLGVADARGPKGRVERIGTLLRTGQSVLVQVKADAVGAKGPTLTMDVTLPGRFLVHAPLGRGIAVSKRLAQGPAKADLVRRLEAVVLGEGWIARSGAGTADPDLLAQEAEALVLAWRAVRMQADGPAPALVRSGSNAAQRALIEHGTPSRIAVEGRDLAASLAAWCTEFAPDLAGRVEAYTATPGLFEMSDLDSEIDTLLGTRVPLSAGGSLVIERTEALTVVDVNAGERGNALDANLEAAREIARQLRLRNVGGIVVVDFVNMKSRGEAERLLTALSAAVADDPAQTQVYGLSKLGLVEMTRARRGTALADLLVPDSRGGNP